MGNMHKAISSCRALNFLYPLGPLSLSEWHNNELRYSLRSIEPFDPQWVGIVGPELPAFLIGVHHIAAHPLDGNRYRNVQEQLLAACSLESTPEELILMNDDFMVRQTPTWDWTQHTHMGPIVPRRLTQQWHKSIADTATWLAARGVQNALNYEGHTPFPFLKSKAKPILEALLASKEILQFRSAYGNLEAVGGSKYPNAKKADPALWPEKTPFWSLRSDPSSEAKAFLENWLPKPSQWEVI